MTKNFKILNEPFVLWFLSSIVVAFVSWQYGEVQKNSAERKQQQQVLKKASLELRLILQDIKHHASSTDKTTFDSLYTALNLMKYNATSKENQFYSPTLQNVMLEVDSRTDSNGLEKFQSDIFKHLTVLGDTVNRQTQWEKP